MNNKRDKFEFEKLEIPKSLSTEPQTEILKESVSKNNNSFGFWLIGFVVSIILIFALYYFITNTFKKKIQNTSIKVIPIKNHPITKSEARPVYFNYYDSIVFLNKHTDNKIVISKGFDDYVKKNKLVIKSGNYYFNCFCDDLYSTYKPGDVIP
ncbi:MAG: hypothetical protein MUF45_10800 [Spirosomaceae bacterium]|nr:hypothetical protein [Spirosomataceae bacterium]